MVQILHKCKNCGIIHHTNVWVLHDIGGSYMKCKICGAEDVEHEIVKSINIKEVRKVKLQQINDYK